MVVQRGRGGDRMGMRCSPMAGRSNPSSAAIAMSRGIPPGSGCYELVPVTGAAGPMRLRRRVAGLAHVSGTGCSGDVRTVVPRLVHVVVARLSGLGHLPVKAGFRRSVVILPIVDTPIIDESILKAIDVLSVIRHPTNPQESIWIVPCLMSG